METEQGNITVTDKVFTDRFVARLLRWNKEENNRQMPWKGEKDPYKIWLSEVILQQTRVDQGLKYYERFIETFPTINDLAKAPEQQVFKLWEGLGYYTRCRNLISTAKYIDKELEGAFPSTHQNILNLKGVGPYTAAAIASFAYNLPHAVLDGNVFRVLSRILDIELPIDSTEGKKLFSNLAQGLLPKKKAGEYNQAIMDFGATVCKPLPECAHCFFNDHCKAFLQRKQAALPVKAKKGAVKERWFHYVILQVQNKIALKERTGKDIWQSLYEPVLIEGSKRLQKVELLHLLESALDIKPDTYTIISAAANTTQRLTHQLIYFSFLHLQLKKEIDLPDYQWISKRELQQLPFPKTLKAFLDKSLL